MYTTSAAATATKISENETSLPKTEKTTKRNYQVKICSFFMFINIGAALIGKLESNAMIFILFFQYRGGCILKCRFIFPAY